MNISELEKLEVGEVLSDVSMLNYTTYKVNGTIACVIYPNNIDGLKKLVNYLERNKLKYRVLGNGSNVIFKNGKFDGIIIKLDKFNKLEIDDTIINVGAGYSLMKLALKLTEMGLSGLEFATGIPGSVGGAVYMNAGAYGSEISNLVLSVTVFRDNQVVILSKKDMNFGYRTNVLHGTNDIVLEVSLKLQKGDTKKMIALVEDRKKRRIESQPIDMPSCGSVFRNTDDNPAWKLIADCDLREYRIGGAEISNKHTNFIINTGDATSDDIIKLIMYIKEKIKQEYDIELISEQEIIE